MRTENLLNRRIFGFKSLRGYYLWCKTVKNSIIHSNHVSFSDRMWCLMHGFDPIAIKRYGRDELKDNYKNYLTTKEYFKLHPLNGVYSFWIDDKLTTKYVFSKYGDWFPKYYFQLEQDKILRLYDCQKKYELTADGVMACIDDVGALAFKRMVGSYGKGFYRIERDRDAYLVSGKRKSRAEVKKLISGLYGYLVMECIENCKEIKEIFSGSLNTIRMQYSNVDGNPVLLRSFIRFGNSKSNGVDNAKSGGLVAIVDVKTGETFYAFQQDDKGYVIEINEHPDTHKSLIFKIPQWEEIKDKLNEICISYPQLSYLGFDIAITDTGFSIIEINSLSGLESIQARRPMCSDEESMKILRKFGLKR